MHTILNIIFWLAIMSIVVFIFRLLAILLSTLALLIGKFIGKFSKSHKESSSSLQEIEQFIQLGIYVLLGVSLWGQFVAYHFHWNNLWYVFHYILIASIIAVIVNFVLIVIFSASYTDFTLND